MTLEVLTQKDKLHWTANNKGPPEIEDIHTSQYADDIALSSTNPQDLQHNLNALNTAFTTHGMEINVKKTEVLFCRAPEAPGAPGPRYVPKFTINNQTLPWKYLGGLIDENGGITAEIRRRIALAAGVF